MSLGRVDTFLDTYIERDMKTNKLTEEQVITHTHTHMFMRHNYWPSEPESKLC